MLKVDGKIKYRNNRWIKNNVLIYLKRSSKKRQEINGKIDINLLNIMGNIIS